MASITTTTSYLLKTADVLAAAKTIEPLMVNIIRIQKNQQGDYVFYSSSVKSGFTVKNPSVTGTTADLVAFLAGYSGVSIQAGNILNVGFYSDQTFIEVVVS